MAFSLVELLAVIAIIGILSSLLLPTMAKGKAKSHTIRCASNMRNWGQATHLYIADYDDRLPLFGDHSSSNMQSYWHTKIAPYLALKAQADMPYKHAEVFTNGLRRCPGGGKGRPPFSTETSVEPSWNCWIGANFGALGQPLTAPFYYGDRVQPLNITRITKPADAMLYLDGYGQGIYTPVQDRYRFVLDLNHDGAVDTMAAYPDVPFNYARPTVHRNGANVTLLDGHVERVPFEKLWNVDLNRQVTHSFWYIED